MSVCKNDAGYSIGILVDEHETIINFFKVATDHVAVKSRATSSSLHCLICSAERYSPDCWLCRVSILLLKVVKQVHEEEEFS